MAVAVVVLDLDRGMAAMVGANERRGVVVIVFSDDSILVLVVGIASSLFMLRRRARCLYEFVDLVETTRVEVSSAICGE
jgi:hypothetical protein